MSESVSERECVCDDCKERKTKIDGECEMENVRWRWHLFGQVRRVRDDMAL